MKTHNEIPLEGLLKYIKADRDEYKAKLDKLIPYAKSLERRVTELEEIIKKRNETIKRQEDRIGELNREVTRTPLYKSLQERYVRVKKDNTALLLQLAKTYREKE